MSESEVYKKYDWKGYKGYSYNGSKSGISFNILFEEENKDGDYITLSGKFDTITTDVT